MQEGKIEWPLIGMTLEETAQALRVSPRTIQELILRSDFPARKIGVQWRIDPDAIKAWLAGGRPLSADKQDEPEQLKQVK